MPIERVTKAVEAKDLQHLVLENREKLSLTGAEDILNFSESSVELETNLGLLTIRGEGLKIVNISAETKTAEVSGRVNSLEYKNRRERKGFLKSLFK